MRARPALSVILLAFGIWLASAAGANAATCPRIVQPAKFASKEELSRMTAKFNSFGPRLLGSAAHNKAIDYLENRLRHLGLGVKSGHFKPYGWFPRTHFKNGPGLDIGAAGGLSVTRPGGSTVHIPDAGAVHWTTPTGKRGSRGTLVYLPPEEDITPGNSAGKIVIRDFELGTIPFAGLEALGVGLYQTPDLEGYNEYTRPYLSPNLHLDLVDASKAGAAGVIFAFDVPAKQVRGYYDPHVGMIYRVPAVFVGGAQAKQLKSLAARGSTAQETVLAKIARRKTRNLIATLPGRSFEKIVLAANTDGNSWVQEDGVIGMLAFARYYSGLPKGCRPRTLELVFSSAHDAYRNDGLNHYHLDKPNTAFAFTIEHLGTREILPSGEGANSRLEFTGLADPALFAAGDSDALRQTAVAVTRRRHLPRTAVAKGLGVPNQDQAPPICSMGGLGNAFHPKLVPTLAMISGPWSLYDPAFGRRALDFGQMRRQMLAAGDAILALDGLPRTQIAGDYPALQADLDNGTKTPCPTESFPLYAPGPSQ